MALENEPFRWTAAEAASAISSDKITVEQYATSLLQRIEERDPIVKAWVYLDRDAVLAQAKHLDSVPKSQRGPLHGVAIAIKDVIFVKGRDGSFSHFPWPPLLLSSASIFHLYRHLL